MDAGWNMGDLNAAQAFQQQVRRGDLNSGRPGRATRGAGPQMSPSFAATSDRDSSRRPARDSANNTAGTWGSRLATAPPSHLFMNGDIAKAQFSQPTPADNRGEPMVVDDEFYKPQTGMSNSRWGGDTNNVTVSTLGFDRSTEPRSGAVKETMKAMPQPGSPVRGLGASNWNRPTSIAAPSIPVHGPAVDPARDFGGSNWIRSTSGSGSGLANSAVVPQQTNLAPSGLTSKATWQGSHMSPIVTVQGFVPATQKPSTITSHAAPPSRGGSEKAQSGHSPNSKYGLVNSRWATTAKSTPQVQGKGTVMNTVFGKDIGPVVDLNWIYTYQVEDGGRIYNLAARKAQDAGDRVAAISLSNVAELSAEVVRARIMLHDTQAEREARNAANRAAKLAADAFDKYHPPLPKGLIVEDTTFHSMQERMGDGFDAQSIRTSIAPQPSAPAPAGPVLAEAVQPAGFNTAFDHRSNLPCGDTHAMKDTRPAIQQPVAGGHQNNNACDVTKQQSAQQAKIHQQSETGQQSQTVQRPALDLQSIPTNFDDPRARQMLEEFFFARGTN